MWDLLGKTPVDIQTQLLDQFCRLFVQLHDLEWKQYDNSLLDDDLFFFIDRWLNEARGSLQKFPEVYGSPFLAWVAARTPHLLAHAHPRCTRIFIQEMFW